MRFLLKLILIVSLMILFLMSGFFLKHLVPCKQRFRRKLLIKNTGFWCKGIALALNLKVSISEKFTNSNDKAKFLIANHMSYIDVIAMSCKIPTLYITSVDMKQNGFLGWLTQMGGCLYVERRNPKDLHKEVKKIKEVLDSNVNVTLYPEGTSSNGLGILPFRKSLFQIPFTSESEIQPVIMSYTKINNKQFSVENCDKVAWYKGMTFLPHFIELLKLKKIEAHIGLLDTLLPNNFENRKTLCDFVEDQINLNYPYDDKDNFRSKLPEVALLESK